MSSAEISKNLHETFKKCLHSPEPFESSAEKEICRRMVEALPEELVVHAANSSYAFWYLSRSSETAPSEDVKIGMAMREARRHYQYVGKDFEKGLKNMIESLEYRKEQKLDLLRLCFGSVDKIPPEEQPRAKKMAELIRADMSRQYNVMRGHDRDNRTILIKFPRVKAGTTEESYILTQIYMAERSTAATEFRSMGAQERSIAVYDYNGFDSSNAPPYQMQLNAAVLLQKTFPERLGVVVMVEPPFWLRSLLKMITPFLSKTITDRISWATGVDEKTKVFGPMVDAEQATPLLLKDGKLDTPVSLDHFLVDVPFYGLYDDVECARPIELDEKKLHLVSISQDETPSLTTSVWSSFSSLSIF